MTIIWAGGQSNKSEKLRQIANQPSETTMKPTTRKKQENLNGNFGAARIQGKRDSLDLTKEILNKDNLRIPNPNESYNKLVIAYNTTTDAKLKVALWEMLRARKATLQPTKVKPMVKPASEFGDYCRRTR